MQIETIFRAGVPRQPWYRKINPIWWLGNVEGIEAWFMPGRAPIVRSLAWWWRNPCYNFFRFVVGVEDRPIYVTGPVMVAGRGDVNQTTWWDIDGKSVGWKWTVIKTAGWGVRLPFVSYEGPRWIFYAGWMSSGGRCAVKIVRKS